MAQPSGTTRNNGSSNGSSNSDARNGAMQRSRQHGKPERSGSARLSTVLREMQEMSAAIAKSGETSERERKLLEDNFKLRRRNARLLDELESGGGALEDGAVVLSGDDAKEFEAFKALNVKADALVTIVKEHGTLAEEKALRDAQGVYDEAADELEIPNVAAFRKLMQREKMHVEFQTASVRDPENGNKRVSVRVPVCRPMGDTKAALVPVFDYLEDHQAEFLPALLAEPEENDGQSDDDDSDGAAGGSALRRTFGTRSERTSAADSISSMSGASASGRKTFGGSQRGTQSSNGASSTGGVPMVGARGERRPGGPRTPTLEQDVARKRSTGGYGL